MWFQIILWIAVIAIICFVYGVIFAVSGWIPSAYWSGFVAGPLYLIWTLAWVGTLMVASRMPIA